jgi:hypothetical protein
LEYLPENLGLRGIDCLGARPGDYPYLVPDFDSVRPFTFTYIVADNTRAAYSSQ